MAERDTAVVSQVGAAPAGLPDLNAGRYGFDLIQKLIDRAAWINMFVLPQARAPWPIQGAGGIVGIQGNATLHRFETNLEPPSLATGVRTSNRIGQASGNLRLRWMMAPYDFEALPGLEPPATPFDLTLSQRFAMLEDTFTFADGSGFTSFGTGRTFPITTGEGPQRVEVAAIGNVTGGFGKFSGLEGTCVVCGHLTAEHGFQGDILVRMVDLEGRLTAAGDLPPFVVGPETEPDITYIVWRGQKSGPEQKTRFTLTEQGQVRGLTLPQIFLQGRVDFSAEGSAGIRSILEVGPRIGTQIGYVTTNPLHPDTHPGTAVSPSRFQGVGIYRVRDFDGNEVGSFTPQFLEGRTFTMQLTGAPGQPAARFGFFGPILYGTGVFSGVSGMFLGNTGVGIAPHVLSNIAILRLHDPQHRFRTL
jgi:hypothetical protein